MLTDIYSKHCIFYNHYLLVLRTFYMSVFFFCRNRIILSCLDSCIMMYVLNLFASFFIKSAFLSFLISYSCFYPAYFLHGFAPLSKIKFFFFLCFFLNLSSFTECIFFFYMPLFFNVCLNILSTSL